MFSSVILLVGFIRTVLGGSVIRNGCTSEDLTYFSVLVAEFFDLITIRQNSGSPTQQYTDLVTESFSEDNFKFLLADPDNVLLEYESAGKLWTN